MLGHPQKSRSMVVQGGLVKPSALWLGGQCRWALDTSPVQGDSQQGSGPQDASLWPGGQNSPQSDWCLRRPCMVFRAAWAECHDGRGGHAPASRQPGLPDLPELGPSRRAGRWAGVPPMAGCVPGRVPVEGAVLPLLPGGPRCPPTPRSAPTRGSVAQQAGWGAGPSSCCHLPEPQCRARMGRSQAMPQSAGPGREARGGQGHTSPS